jgi:hypothetical protein
VAMVANISGQPGVANLLFYEHENSNKENSNKENPKNREPRCIYTIEYANSERSSLFIYNPCAER